MNDGKARLWTAKQKTALNDWLEKNSYKLEDKNFMDKETLSPEDINLLRSMPGFADIESQVIPQSNENIAKKLASDYKTIADIPEEYLNSFKEDGLTEDDVKKAFANKEKEQAEAIAKKKKEQAEAKYKQMSTDQELRAKDLKDAQELSFDKSLSQNALALGLKLTPKEADRYFIQHGLDDKFGLMGSAALGTIANALEALPNPIFGILGGPLVREIEAVKSQTPYGLQDFAQDMTWNTVGYAPFRRLGELAKSALGQFIGPALEKTSIVEGIAKGAKALDRASVGDKAITARKNLQDKYFAMYQDIPNMNKLEVEKVARDMEKDGFSGMANAARDYNVTKKVGAPIDYPEEMKQDLLFPNRYFLDEDKETLRHSNSRKKVGMNRVYSEGTKKNRQEAINQAIANSPNKWTVRSAKVLDYVGRPAFRIKTSPDVDTNMIRQWESGFVPRKGSDLYEQYLIWKEGK